MISVIVKVGGSVADRLEVIFRALSKAERAYVIPGGWVFADAVRKVDAGLSPTTSHWMAIAAMNIYGLFIAEVAENYGFSVLEPNEFKEFEKCKRAVVLPYMLLRKYDELPHSWDVTSDSISVWFAHMLGFKEVVKVTAAGGISGEKDILPAVKASDVKSNVVDPYTPELLLKYGINMFVCSPEELKDYILRGRAKGTLIEGR